MKKELLEEKIKSVEASFDIENMEMTEDTKAFGRRLLSGEVTIEEEMKEIISNYGEII